MFACMSIYLYHIIRIYVFGFFHVYTYAYKHTCIYISVAVCYDHSIPLKKHIFIYIMYKFGRSYKFVDGLFRCQSACTRVKVYSSILCIIYINICIYVYIYIYIYIHIYVHIYIYIYIHIYIYACIWLHSTRVPPHYGQDIFGCIQKYVLPHYRWCRANRSILS